LRAWKEWDYSHLKTHSNLHVKIGGDNSRESLATAQMSMRKGLLMFGGTGVDAVKKEMMQLHDHGTIKPKHTKDLTPEEKDQALAYLMFLKCKRCGKVKGRGCANGRKQQAYIDRADATSPTVMMKAVFLMALIDAFKN
jgi:hypothetical protein